MIKVFVNNKEMLYAPGLACVVGKVRIAEESPKSNLASTSLEEEPSPKLDQHEPSHSRALHVINDACFNMMHDDWHTSAGMNSNKVKIFEYNFPSQYK